MIRINQLRLPLGYKDQDVMKAIIKKTHIKPDNIISWKIIKESIDARKSRGNGHAEDILCILSVSLKLNDEKKFLKKNRDKDISLYEPVIYSFPYKNDRTDFKSPVIVGAGPAGLFCALMLSRAGFKPILLERGCDVHKRMELVNAFWENGSLCPDSNVQFGEGGAGTFSDGKLNTLVKDPRGLHRKVLEEFVKAGAPEEILYKNKPHLGTDALVNIVENIRNEIVRCGGQVRFESKVTSFSIDADKHIRSVEINGREEIRTDQLILAIGHSARDTYQKLFDIGMTIEPKSFAIGVRIEHPQEMIGLAQYGQAARHLPPADYKLTYKASTGRSVYTFCMCPGGWVVNASSEEGGLAVNGMSYKGRDSQNANSAVIVSVRPDDFGGDDPLAGIRFQRKWERLAFEEGKGAVPVQLFGDFKEGKNSSEFGQVKPVHKGKISFGNLHNCLPEYVCQSLIEGIDGFSKNIVDFNRKDAILSGVETRTSSPIRMTRDDSLQSNIRGIFPCGEGAGYAGGITSAAMDGIRAAQAAAADILK